MMELTNSRFSVLHQLISHAQALKASIAVYSFPGSDTFTFHVSLPGFVFDGDDPFFYVHPFSDVEEYEAIQFQGKSLEQSDFEKLVAPYLAQTDPFWQGWDLQHPLHTTSPDYFKACVRQAQLIFEEGTYQKLMMCRCFKHDMPANFDVLVFLQKLRKAYPNAFVYALATEQTGTWLGATPELLVHKSGNTLDTVSLAGTRKKDSKTAWTTKEYHEQELVTRHLLEVIQNQSNVDVDVHGPHDLSIGSLVHLQTKIRALFKSGLTQHSFFELVSAIHPTPAIGGYPKRGAAQQIREIEQFDRAYYAGFMGPITAQNNATFFVNLRCMQWRGHEGMLIAGAGITSDSDADAELQETYNKSQILASHL